MLTIRLEGLDIRLIAGHSRDDHTVGTLAKMVLQRMCLHAWNGTSKAFGLVID